MLFRGSSQDGSPDFSPNSLAAATLYVDQRTRAMFHWLGFSGMASLQICRDNLFSHLERIATAMREGARSRADVELIESQLPLVRDCDKKTDLDKIRIAFKLPKMQELLASRESSSGHAAPVRRTRKSRKRADLHDPYGIFGFVGPHSSF